MPVLSPLSRCAHANLQETGEPRVGSSMMVRRRLSLAALLLALSLIGLAGPGASGARAANVVVMGHNGRTRVLDDRYLSAADSLDPATDPAFTSAGDATDTGTLARGGRAHALSPFSLTASRAHPSRRGRGRSSLTVPVVLARLAAHGQITSAQARGYTRQWDGTLAEERHLSRPRASQLAAVTQMLHDMAVRGSMTASRLPVLFLTLSRNAEYWKHGQLLGYGQRVLFAGSELEWEYYTGEGIQLQVLGTFGEANGFYEAGRSTWPNLVSLMSEMIPLAVHRGGGIAWEYYFDWEGGSPPWVSAMAEGTGLEALTNAYLATHNPMYLSTAHAAMGILRTAPPSGVAVGGAAGTEFLQYGFAPHTDIINAFLQTLIGLYDYAKVSGDPVAGQLFNAGNAQAQSVLGSFNTGAWSLYQPGVQDDLSYHQLVTGFLQTLCSLTATPIYCSTYQAFSADLRTPPVLTQLTQHVPAHRITRLAFHLDKPAHVGVVVTGPDGRTDLYTSANCAPGNDFWILPRLSGGTYTVQLSGTDLAGNYATESGTLSVG